MLRELLTYLSTPCAPLFRRQGYLSEQIALRARHRRCKAAWAPHLENTEAVIRKAMAATGRRGRAVVLGSGHLLDVPLEDLAAGFAEVVLVDVVHPRAVVRRARRLGNVRLERWDVSGVAAAVADAVRTGAPLPVPPPPSLAAAADLVCSVNLVSQLPLRPEAALLRAGHHAPDRVERFCREIVAAHFAWLRALAASGVTVAVVADVAREVSDGYRTIEEKSPLFGFDPPGGGEVWRWDIAPRPEAYRDRDVRHEVGAWIWSGNELV